MPTTFGSAIKLELKVNVVGSSPVAWHLRIQCYKSCDSSLIPDPGTSTCPRCGPEKKMPWIRFPLHGASPGHHWKWIPEPYDVSSHLTGSLPAALWSHFLKGEESTLTSDQIPTTVRPFCSCL